MNRSSDHLRILLMGDASNFHRCLAEGLRRRGHEVVIASDGSKWLDTEREIDTSRPLPGKWGGLALYLRLKRLMRQRLSGFDIVSLSGVGFVELRPQRIAEIFSLLKGANGRVFLNMLSADSNYVRYVTSPGCELRYSEYMIGTRPAPFLAADPRRRDQWLAQPLSDLCDRVYREVDGVTTALYEYDVACRPIVKPNRLTYTGIPIDTSAIEYRDLPERPDRVKLFVGRHRDRQIEKGTDRLYTAARRVADRHPDRCEVILVENRPYKEYLELLRDSHVVLDQLYSYTPATNAMLAMAMGKVAVTGAEPEFYDFIGETSLRPIVNALPDDDALVDTLERLVLDPAALRERGRQSREFVVKHNDVDRVAARALAAWTK